MDTPNGERDQQQGQDATDTFLRQLMRSVFSAEEGGSGAATADAPVKAGERKGSDVPDDPVYEVDLQEVGSHEETLAAEETAQLRNDPPPAPPQDLHPQPEPPTPPQELRPEPEPEPAPVRAEAGEPEADRSETDPRMLDDLQSPSPDVRLAALQRLQQDPSDAPVVGVTARLQDPEPEVRAGAVKVLEALADDRILLLLLDSLEDPAEDVRDTVRDTFRSHRGGALVDLLKGELAVPAHTQAAAGVLADMGEVEALLEAARSGSPETKRIVNDVLDRTGTVRDLIAALSDRRPDERRIACEQLGSLASPEAVEPLIERLSDPDRGVRIKAADALGRIGDRRALHALKRAYIWDPDSSVVVSLGEAIRRISGVLPGRDDA